jgi:hypothetical protein
MARASAQKERRIDKCGPMLLTGIDTVDADVTRQLSALLVVLWSSGQLSWNQPDTLG